MLSINSKIQVESDKLLGWKQFLQLLLNFLKLSMSIKSPQKVTDIEGTRLQIAIIVEKANAHSWYLPYDKAEFFSRGTHYYTVKYGICMQLDYS